MLKHSEFLSLELSAPEKQPHTIIPPPPNFTLGTMQSDKYRSPGNRQTQTRPSDCQMEKCNLSLQGMHLHCSRVQWRRTLRQNHTGPTVGRLKCLGRLRQGWEQISSVCSAVLEAFGATRMLSAPIQHAKSEEIGCRSCDYVIIAGHTAVRSWNAAGGILGLVFHMDQCLGQTTQLSES